jgi:cytochrome c oxidase assembly protein Cox11/cytochrome c2
MNQSVSLRRKLGIAGACLAIVTAMVLLVAYSLPLYRAFCEATGLGGTTQRVASDRAAASSRTIAVRFNADIAPGLPWRFGPSQPSVTVHLGEQTLVSFWAENLSDQPIIGHATYNVTPDLAGRYFDKIQCFCFNEERLGPHERVEMPVSFYVDPAMLDDKDMGGLPAITLSYTFFRSTAPSGALDLARFGETPTAAAETNAGDSERGQTLFAARCGACHALDHDKIGPALGGLGGRKAGGRSGYGYSAALAADGRPWDTAALDSWLTDPRARVPGTRMAISVASPRDRADIEAYLLGPKASASTAN